MSQNIDNNVKLIYSVLEEINDSTKIVSQNNVEYLEKIIKSTIHNLVDNVINNQLDSLISELEIQRSCRNKVRKFAYKKNKDSYLNIIYVLGKYDGVYSTMIETVDKIIEKNNNNEILSKLHTRNHLLDILKYIHDNPLSQHKDIAIAVNVKPNYLSELITILENYSLINRYNNGKYTHYSLTNKGDKICEIYNKKTSEIVTQDILTKKDNFNKYIIYDSSVQFNKQYINNDLWIEKKYENEYEKYDKLKGVKK